MIFPFFNGILDFKYAPVTWALVFAHALVMVVSYVPIGDLHSTLNEVAKDEYFLKTQGRLYAQYITDHRHNYSETLEKMARLSLAGDDQESRLLGHLAFKNKEFTKEARSYDFSGDQVAIDYWRSKLEDFQTLRNKGPMHTWGLTANSAPISHWASYVFVHSGLMHFGLNMLMLLIFGCLLEPVIGGLGLLVCYLGLGMVAAGFFVLTTGASSAPLIGASGAISGLVGMTCVLFARQPVRYIYWLLVPSQNYLGFVYLPGWVCLLLFMVSDLAGFISGIPEMGGVAYAAHLGGEIGGLLIGAVVYFLYQRDGRLPVGSNNKMGEMVLFHHQPQKAG